MSIQSKIKQKLVEAFRLYFILVTLITILLMIVGLLFDSDRTFGYEVFFSPLFYAFIGVIPVFFFQSDKELSMKQHIIRSIIQILMIEAAILLIVYKAPSIPSDRIEVVISIAVGILIVYILSLVVEYIFELTQAREMNIYLEEYQKIDNP
ncbi:MAG: hypothetical protein K6B68_05310 [Eubacterium sp.]|nr:hypothetical protein [Eubacterium sp.]